MALHFYLRRCQHYKSSYDYITTVTNEGVAKLNTFGNSKKFFFDFAGIEEFFSRLTLLYYNGIFSNDDSNDSDERFLSEVSYTDSFIYCVRGMKMEILLFESFFEYGNENATFHVAFLNYQKSKFDFFTIVASQEKSHQFTNIGSQNRVIELQYRRVIPDNKTPEMHRKNTLQGLRELLRNRLEYAYDGYHPLNTTSRFYRHLAEHASLTE